jgi:hypothetical protein
LNPKRRLSSHSARRSPTAGRTLVGVAGLALAGACLLLAPAIASAATTGSIAGEVTDSASATAIKGVEVCAYSLGASEGEESCSPTGANGTYTISSLPPGQYKVEFWAPNETLNYITQYYDDQSTFTQANKVTVSGGSTTVGIDAKMHEGAQIEGKVTSASGLDPLGEILVCAVEQSGGFGRCALTKADGEYTLSGLQTGEYTIEFWAGLAGLNYLPRYYDEKASLVEAETVSISVGETKAGIDARLQEGGQISGTVTDAASAAKLSGIAVCALERGGSEPEPLGCATTNSAGIYTIPALPSGPYSVEFDPNFEGEGAEASGYLTQYYNEKTTLAQAEPVSVSVPMTTADIDAHLLRSSTLWPASTEAPQLSGSPTVGGTLFCSTGYWSNSPTSYSYKWLRDGAPVAGQTISTYAVGSGDSGDAISCQVKAINSHGSATATSNILQVPIAATPATPPPAVQRVCKKGFRKAKRHGKTRCVKVKKAQKHGRR